MSAPSNDKTANPVDNIPPSQGKTNSNMDRINAWVKATLPIVAAAFTAGAFVLIIASIF